MSDTQRQILELRRRITELEESLARTASGLDSQPARHDKSSAGGAMSYCVIREVENDTDPYVWASPGVVLAETPFFKVLTNNAEMIMCEPATKARHYKRFVWAGPEDGFEGTYDWEAGMIPMPVTTVDGVVIVLHRPRIWMRQVPITTGNKHADCYLVDGGGPNLQLIYP